LRFVQEIGAERVLSGSDIPLGTMANELQKILTLPISDREWEAILGGNICRLTGIAPSPVVNDCKNDSDA
jgi:predicted TIM-barrel fold metal-dependent hydrolase